MSFSFRTSASERTFPYRGCDRLRLYTTNDVEFVTMDEYLGGLASDLCETWSTSEARRDVIADVEPIKLSTDKAVALGMIANEWVSNACKYAYGDSSDGIVRIALRDAGESILELAVEDDGCGLPANGAVRGTGLGTRLIEAMARTHRAEIRYSAPAPGASGTRQHRFTAAPKRPSKSLIASASAIFLS
jgi:two-component sensor histidine kinase